MITLKWKALRGEARAAYAAALCRGWVGRDRAAELIAAWDPDCDDQASRADVAVFEAAHFRRSRTGDGVTGHSALTAVASRRQSAMRPLLGLVVVSAVGWGVYGAFVGSYSQVVFSVAYAAFGLVGIRRIERLKHA